MDRTALSNVNDSHTGSCSHRELKIILLKERKDKAKQWNKKNKKRDRKKILKKIGERRRRRKKTIKKWSKLKER